MKDFIKALLLFLGGSAALGCSGGGPVNIGNTQAKGSQLSDYAASWDGYAQAYTFSDGSDHLRLMIAADGQGTLRAGDTALLPPPTDPSVGYPPSVNLDSPNAGLAMGLEAGFPYPLHAAQVLTDRIQVGVDPGDAFAAWCMLETPVPMTSGGAIDGGDASYGCLPNVSFIAMGNTCALCLGPVGSTCTLQDSTSTPVDCGKLTLCRLAMVCTCTSTACSAVSVPAGAPVNQYPVELDGALDPSGSTLTGTLVLPNSTRVTVVLQKQ